MKIVVIDGQGGRIGKTIIELVLAPFILGLISSILSDNAFLNSNSDS